MEGTRHYFSTIEFVVPSQFDNRFRLTAFRSHKDYFGEPVIYFFRAGGQRSFNAIIERNPPAFYSASGEVLQPEITIRFSNSNHDGVLASEIDINDKVELIADLGECIPTRLTVMKLMSQDSGVCRVALRGSR